jgi:hypothetical protein
MHVTSVDLGDRMSATFRLLTAFGLGLVMQTSFTGLAFAQANTLQEAGPSPYDMSPEQMREAVPPEQENVPELPVLFVTSVEVVRTSAQPGLDIVRVTGLTSSGGWTSPQLVPTYEGKPADDILDLQLIATAPEQSENAEGFAPIGAIFALEQDNPYKGIRVRASENALQVDQIPGRTETGISVNDCKDCVGKKFVAGSTTEPAQGDTVREQDLPKLLRVIKPSDGIRGRHQNPNRLTLMLDRDNTIVEAFWE